MTRVAPWQRRWCKVDGGGSVAWWCRTSMNRSWSSTQIGEQSEEAITDVVLGGRPSG
jgi:hypothetical protein